MPIELVGGILGILELVTNHCNGGDSGRAKGNGQTSNGWLRDGGGENDDSSDPGASLYII